MAPGAPVRANCFPARWPAWGWPRSARLIGGLFIVGIYATVPHLEGVGVFAGVKVGYVLPLLVALAVSVGHISGRSQSMEEWWAETRPRWEGFFRSPCRGAEPS